MRRKNVLSAHCCPLSELKLRKEDFAGGETVTPGEQKDLYRFWCYLKQKIFIAGGRSAFIVAEFCFIGFIRCPITANPNIFIWFNSVFDFQS